MRLLNVYSLKFASLDDPPTADECTGELRLKEFSGRNIPEYAILSHIWNDDEVLFADVCNGTARQRKGFQKLFYTLWQAKKDWIHWAWINTCCIDKSSSRELQEAINSMFKWYQHSRVCYAYLEDLIKVRGEEGWENELVASRWFTRGWTLQELLAPANINLYSKDGDRSKFLL